MLSNKRKAFTLLEVVFVIVILGILASIALPKFAATRDDAQIAKGRSDISSIRAAIVNERQTRLLKGDSSYAASLDGATTSEGQTLFGGTAANPMLQYGIVSKNAKGHWMKTGTNQYQFSAEGDTTTFDYNSSTGTFSCDRDDDLCKKLID